MKLIDDLCCSISQFLYIFTRLSISAPFRAALNIVLPRYPVLVPVLPPLAGHRMFVDLQSQKAFVLGTYEPNVCAALQELVQPGWIVADLGAHVGYITLLLAKLVGPCGRVFAFEPMPDNFFVLGKNVRLNGYKNVVLEQKAVANMDGQSQLYVPDAPYSTQGSLVAKRDKSYLVECVRLDVYWRRLGDLHLNLIKIDVEGAEDAVVHGMMEVLRRWRPVLVVEVHAPNDGSPSYCLEALSVLGYTLRSLDDKGWPKVGTAARGHILAIA